MEWDSIYLVISTGFETLKKTDMNSNPIWGHPINHLFIHSTTLSSNKYYLQGIGQGIGNKEVHKTNKIPFSIGVYNPDQEDKW